MLAKGMYKHAVVLYICLATKTLIANFELREGCNLLKSRPAMSYHQMFTVLLTYNSVVEIGIDQFVKDGDMDSSDD